MLALPISIHARNKGDCRQVSHCVAEESIATKLALTALWQAYEGVESQPYCYAGDHNIHTDGGLGIFIHHTDEDTRSPHGSARVYAGHESCVRASHGLPAKEFSSAMVHYYLPPPREDVRRRNRILAFLPQRLQEAMPHASLPVEIWGMISSYLVQECARSENCRLYENGPVLNHTVSLGKCIWAHYIFIEGVRYLSALSNSQRPGSSPDTNVLIFDPHRPSAISQTMMFHIAEDHLGVRLVVVRPETDTGNLPVDTDAVYNRFDRLLWWRGVCIKEQDSQLEVQTDGLKVRALMPCRKRDAFEEHAWAAPMKPADFQNLAIFLLDGHIPKWLFPGDSHFASFLCNAPDIVGYSVVYESDEDWPARYGPSMLAMHAHRRGEDLSLYRRFDTEFHDKPFWLFFPIHPSERIARLVVLSDAYYMGRSMGHHRGRTRRSVDRPNALQTTLGRTMFWYLPWPAKQRSYLHAEIVRDDGAPSRIHYNLSSTCHDVCQLAITPSAPLPKTPGPDKVPEFPNPSASHFLSLSNRARVFYAEARLDHILRITTFRGDEPKKPNRISGILFEYGNSLPPVCLGSCCLDRANPAVDMAGRDAFWLCFADTGPRDIPYVNVVEFDRVHGAAESPLMEIKLGPGQLEWWCTCEGEECMVYTDSNGKQVLSPTPREEGNLQQRKRTKGLSMW